jgi:hypothetical protein
VAVGLQHPKICTYVAFFPHVLTLDPCTSFPAIAHRDVVFDDATRDRCMIGLHDGTVPVTCFLHLEHLALRHQLAVYQRSVPRPRLRATDRLCWAWGSRLWAGSGKAPWRSFSRVPSWPSNASAFAIHVWGMLSTACPRYGDRRGVHRAPKSLAEFLRRTAHRGIRREGLDRVMVLHERHLRRLLTRYFQYDHRWRTYWALATDYPGLRLVQQPDDGPIKEVPAVGGWHHHDEQRAAS